MPEPRTKPIDSDPVPGSGLAALVASVQAGSIHSAADLLNLTQSAVTKRLQRLETRLGVQLLTRSPHGVSLTPAGTLVYPQAQAALAALALVSDAVAAHEAASTRVLKIAASHTVGDALLSGWLLAFGHDRPQLRPTVEVINSPGVLHALRAGRVAIGFVEGADVIDDMAPGHAPSQNPRLARPASHSRLPCRSTALKRSNEHSRRAASRCSPRSSRNRRRTPERWFASRSADSASPGPCGRATRPQSRSTALLRPSGRG